LLACTKRQSAAGGAISEGDPDLFGPYNTDTLVYQYVGPLWSIRVAIDDVKSDGNAIQQGGICLGVKIDRVDLVPMNTGKVE